MVPCGLSHSPASVPESHGGQTSSHHQLSHLFFSWSRGYLFWNHYFFLEEWILWSFPEHKGQQESCFCIYTLIWAFMGFGGPSTYVLIWGFVYSLYSSSRGSAFRGCFFFVLLFSLCIWGDFWEGNRKNRNLLKPKSGYKHKWFSYLHSENTCGQWYSILKTSGLLTCSWTVLKRTGYIYTFTIHLLFTFQ